jgi:hypothetical protein
MAEHSAGGTSTPHDYEAHQATYRGFLRGSVALTLLCFFALVALVSFRFGQSLSTLIGFAGLAAGLIAVLIDLRTGSQRWLLSIGALVLFGLLVAINVG